MEKWFEWLNHIMLAKEDIQQFFGCVQQKTDSEASGCQQLEDVYNYAHQQTLKVFGDLDGNRKKMKQEFDAMNNELRSQLSLRTQRERELEEQLREIKKECDEKTKVIEVVSSQVAELDKTFDHLNNKLTEDLKNIESTTNQLQTSLQEELIRKENLSTKLKVTDELICKAKIEMRDEESEMKSLDSNHKQLIVEGENYCSKLKDDLEELNSLQANYDSMRAQFCTLSGVDEDNGSLKLKIDELIEIHDSYKNKLADISVVEKCRSDELNNINNLIENKEIEKARVIQECLDMEEEITKLRAEFENNSLQRNKQRSETDEHFAGLMKEKSSVLAKINDLAKEMKEATDDREEFESKTTDLTKEMRRLKDICAEADGELFSYLTEANVVQSGQRNQMIVVDEMVARNQQEVDAAELNIQECEQLQAQITKMEADLSTQQVKYTQTLADLQASYREQLEAKKKYLEDLRIRYEMEFKNKEQKKLDAMMELKEIKDNIVDHQKKRKSLQNEVKLTGNNLWKYNNLIQKMEEKLKVVAEVATVSQPVKDISSQDSRLTLKENVPLQPKVAGYPTAPGAITRKILPPQVSTIYISSQL
ncbi:hypothetical protein J6590_015953 [Homalodisca vitripennis]|nr:hypothetical protein J6590_015953 [Homalodisca vitripennis]